MEKTNHSILTLEICCQPISSLDEKRGSSETVLADAWPSHLIFRIYFGHATGYGQGYGFSCPREMRRKRNVSADFRCR
jgi:hypothetical protein